MRTIQSLLFVLLIGLPLTLSANEPDECSLNKQNEAPCIQIFTYPVFTKIHVVPPQKHRCPEDYVARWYERGSWTGWECWSRLPEWQ